MELLEVKLKTDSQSSKDLVEKIREGEHNIARASKWTVILYDESKSISIDWKWTYFLLSLETLRANENRLALELRKALFFEVTK